MAKIDVTIQELLTNILYLGYNYDDPRRKGVSRQEVMDFTLEHDFKDGFPAVTLKKLAWKTVVGELLWFLRGGNDITQLHKDNVRIWDKDAYALYTRKCKAVDWEPLPHEKWLEHVALGENSGDVGPIYGVQWRGFGGVDQIASIVRTLKTNPMDTQMIVSAWNPPEIDKMALPPCHYEFQVVARPLRKIERLALAGQDRLSMTDLEMTKAGIPTHGIKLVWSQRSVDTFLGLPFNIASYALLCCILAHLSGTVPLGIKGNLKNVHLYNNSIEESKEIAQLDPFKHEACTLKINSDLLGITELEDFIALATPADFTLEGYESYKPVKVEMLARD